MKINKLDFFAKIPLLNKITPVYAIITLAVYGWTLYWFLYEVPGWLGYLYPLEVVRLYADVLIVNLLESLSVLFVLLALCVLLPRAWFSDGFVYRGTMTSLFLVVYFIALIVRRSQIMQFSTNMIVWFPAFLVVALILITLSERILFIKQTIESFADRAVILLYINLPVSVLALVVVIGTFVFGK